MNFTIGENLGDILIEIAQEKIKNCKFDDAIYTYSNTFPGITKGLILKILKNELVVVTNDDHQTISLTDDENIKKKNQHNIYDWNIITKNIIDDIQNELQTIVLYKSNIKFDINDYCLYRIILNPINDKNRDELSPINTLVARYISGEKLSLTKLPPLAHLLDEGNENFFGLDEEYKNLYIICKYVDCIRHLYKNIIKLDKLYHFLIENKLIAHIRFIEDIFERSISQFLLPFVDEDKGYHHPLCDKPILELKQNILNNIKNTACGKEFLENGIVTKNIEDGYDAGYLTPEGVFYGLNGSANELLHTQLTDMLTSKLYSDTKYNSLDSEYNLMKQYGLMKIHGDHVYGFFTFNKEEAEKEGIFCPTDKQIDAICRYANLYHRGEINTDTGLGYHPVRISALKQMDEIALRNTFAI